MPKPDLTRIEELVKLLDHPELTYPSVQVTGTNGKTTTARAVGSLACAHGLTTGTFVSPHVLSVTERLSVCSAPIDDGEFGEEYERLLPYLLLVDDRVGPVSYFEALTALAFVWFADKPVGLGVFEVGMGGTWDATNVVRGDVAVLCPIGLDHMTVLGDTVEAIANEKAGIVKDGRTAVVRRQRPGALRVIEARAAAVGATLLLEDRDFALEERTRAVGGQVIRMRGVYADYEDLVVPLHGDPAARNAAAAVVACEAVLGRELDPNAVREGLAGAAVPGRLEVVGRRPAVVLDGAHNPDAAAALAATLPEAFSWRTMYLVIGMFEDKDVEAVAAGLAPLAPTARVIATRPEGPRAAGAERVAAALERAGFADVAIAPTVPEAVLAAREAAGEADLILVTGSFYTVAGARPLFVGA
ncbi:MAG TPA: Mur ligase family protein [Actinomycetota bacterium]|nr:Mur ligase family protein [Actinomycetota bacterium]